MYIYSLFHEEVSYWRLAIHHVFVLPLRLSNMPEDYRTFRINLFVPIVFTCAFRHHTPHDHTLVLHHSYIIYFSYTLF